MQANAENLATGNLIGDWRLLNRLAGGPRGEVFRVAHQISDKDAVLRLLPRSRSTDDLFRSRFFRECDVAAQITAPEVARVLGWGDHEGRVWCVTECLANGTLADALRSGWAPDGAEVVRIGIRATRGLAAAHLAGLFHRGLQPSDLLMRIQQPNDQVLDEDSGRVALAGFALTSDLSGREAVSDVLEPPTSPACTAPERLRRKPTDQRSDLYSLGCVLYWAMARRPPFSGEHDEVVRQHLESQPIPLRIAAPACPPGFDEVVACLLRKDPQFRYPNAMALLEDLERISRGGTPNQARQIKSAEATRQSSSAILATTTAAPIGRSNAEQAAPPSKRQPWLAVALIGAVALIAGGVATQSLLPRHSPAQESEPQHVVSPSVPATAQSESPTAEPDTFPPRSTPHATTAVVVPELAPAGPSGAEIAAAKREVEAARIRALEAKIATLIKTGAHLGPVEDLTAQLGSADLSEDSGSKLWYGDYAFTVSDGLVLGVAHHQPRSSVR